MKITSTLLLAYLLCGAAFARDRITLTPESISHDIDRRGAKASVQKLYDSKNSWQWEAVSKKIETGDRRWLAVANRLADGTDAATSESLETSLAVALTRNPRGVLRLVDTRVSFALGDICGVPFIEVSHDFAMRYMIAARRALKDLRDPEVEQKRVRCLALIEQYLSEEAAKR